jgi:Zn-dependent protease/CBS domain-containing protein
MRGIRIGSAFGIPVRLHWTFVVVLPLFAAVIGWDIGVLAEFLNEILAADIDPAGLEGQFRPWLLGLSATLGLFIGVLAHEFGHSLVALRYGYEIESITLWLLGGLANFTEMPEDWRDEFLIAVAGPAVSVGVGAGCYLAFVLLPPAFDPGRFVFGYLALLNVFLAAFNLLPAFPMDGGRVLRALLGRNQPHARATKQAAEVGKFFAFVMGIIGVLALNVVLILLAFFIYIAAAGEAQQTVMKTAFEGVQVRDIMTGPEELHVVSPETTVAQLRDLMFAKRHVGFPVVSDGTLVGMVTLSDVREVREVERDAYRVEEVMTSDVVTTRPDADAIDALQELQKNDIGRLPVVNEAGALIGIVSRTDLMTAFDILRGSESTGAFTGNRRNVPTPENR